MRAKRALRGFRAPDERGAEQRAWGIVQRTYQTREPESAHSTRFYGRSALALAAAVLVGALALSPAGATVDRLINRALGVPHAARALSSLPTPGKLLVSGRDGAWMVAGRGSTTRLGSWSQASWSPHGLFATVVRGDRLVAIDPHGGVRWELVRSALSDPSWYSPTGYRVAYLTGDQVRVVAGDGSGDHLLATGVARVAPAWRPAHPYQLAYVSGGGRVVLRDADTRRLIWSAPAIGGVELLEWSPGGQRLLVVSRSSVRVFTPGSAASSTISLPAASPVVDGALSPDGRILALVLGGEGGAVYTDQLTGRQRALHRVLAGVGLRQVIWSPDGRWLLVSWPAANQWVFVRVLGAPRIAAVSRISQTFATGRHQSFPQLDGWCCTAAQAPR